MINDVFLTTTLQDLMDKLDVQAEQVLTIWYTFSLEKPQKKKSFPTDEWISAFASLSHLKNTKAKTYACAFFNGDVKIYDGKDADHKELLVVQNLHEDKVDDVLYVKSDTLSGKKFLVSCSVEPFPDLKVCEVSQKENGITVLAQASREYADSLGGWNCLSLCPTDNELFAASSINFKKKAQESDEKLSSVQLYRLSEETLGNMSVKTGSNKR